MKRLNLFMQKFKHRNMVIGITLIIFGYILPDLFEFFLVNMIVDIRKSIVMGDSGHLVLTAALWSFLMMVQQVLLFNGLLFVTSKIAARLVAIKWTYVLNYTFLHGLLLIVVNEYSFLPIEYIPAIVSSLITLVILVMLTDEGIHLERNLIISILVFYAMQWINVMPIFSSRGFGSTDIPASIKVAAVYLGSTSVLNLIGLIFLTILILSIIMTSFLFITYDRSIAIARENYEKELALDSIRQKAVQNRMYEELHTITHDLKTPLVTIRGLNSLISISKDTSKKIEYTDRIDNAVTKMTDMISGFLYESSKKIVSAEAIIDYVRAQIPIEDEKLRIDFNLEDNLPDLYINKIRVSRALINVLDNAMKVPTKYPIKEVGVNVYEVEDQLAIDVIDNGIGISKKHMEKIWEIGYSTKESTGLGLAFGKKVIEDNGGTITIDSKVDIGTTVRIILPNETLVDREER